MHDPLEGLDDDGRIRTGVDVGRVHDRYADLLDSTVDLVLAESPFASVHLYGSVATGQAISPTSDVDLVAIGVAEPAARSIGEIQSRRFAGLCRAVEIGASTSDDFVGDDDESYGNRIFLHHYCIQLAGPPVARDHTAFLGDRRAARGFNGDIAVHLARWRSLLGEVDPHVLGRRVARKTLLAVAGLVSIHDATWTTDRHHAVHRFGVIEPSLAPGLVELARLSDGAASVDVDALARLLDGSVATIARRFEADVGVWSTT